MLKHHYRGTPSSNILDPQPQVMAVISHRPATRVEPKSPHVSDNTLQAFLQQDFDPADYLNNTLPSLSTSTSNTLRPANHTQDGGTASLPDLMSQTQSLLSQWNAQTSRLSGALTQLTDEILRSGSRLAYEVEVLKSETSELTDALDGGLRSDIERFAPAPTTESNEAPTNKTTTHASAEPEYMDRLRTLTHVRLRLDSVIKVFGEAMQWPIAPSEVSVASSFISVSAPGGGLDDSQSREEKAKAYAEVLRAEINDMIGSGNDLAGLNAAAARVDDLQDLAQVWRGTAEEKARTKFVESLSKPIEERQRAVGRTVEGLRQSSLPSRGVDYRYGGTADPSLVASGEGGYRFLQNLKRIKNEVYLD